MIVAVQDACLMFLVHHTSLLYIWVSSIILYKWRYYSMYYYPTLIPFAHWKRLKLPIFAKKVIEQVIVFTYGKFLNWNQRILVITHQGHSLETIRLPSINTKREREREVGGWERKGRERGERKTHCSAMGNLSSTILHSLSTRSLG